MDRINLGRVDLLPRNSSPTLSRSLANVPSSEIYDDSYPVNKSSGDLTSRHLSKPTFRYIEEAGLGPVNGVRVYHDDYCIHGIRQPILTEPQASIPKLGDARYDHYPFIVTKHWSDNDQIPLRVFIKSESLLGILVDALDLDGGPDNLRNQNGTVLLLAWEALQSYLVKLISRLDLGVQSLGWDFPAQRWIKGIAELELLLYVFLGNYDILSSPRRDGDVVGHDVEAGDLHQQLDDIGCAFYESENSPRVWNPQNIIPDSVDEFSITPRSGLCSQCACDDGHHTPSFVHRYLSRRNEKYSSPDSWHMSEARAKSSLKRVRLTQEMRSHIGRLEHETIRQQDTTLLHRIFKTEHERLLCISKSNTSTRAFQKFGSRFWDYRKAWDNGAVTFHRLIDGHPPSALKEVLSAVLVAGALASVLDSKNETFGMRDEVIGDLDRWKITLAESEKVLFDEIAGLLWSVDPDKPDPGPTERLDEDIQAHWNSFYDLARELIQRSRGLYGYRFHPRARSDFTGGDGSSLAGFLEAPVVEAGCIGCPVRFSDDTETRNVDRPIDLAGLQSAQYLRSPIPVVDAPVLAPKTQGDLESQFLIAIFIMAGSVFWAVFTFLNVRKMQSLRSLDQGTRPARGNELHEILIERVKQSTNTATREIIDTLRNDLKFGAFGGIISAAETRIEQMTLTGFSAVAKSMQAEAELLNVGSGQLVVDFKRKADQVASRCAYVVGQLNVASRCAELAYCLGPSGQGLPIDTDDLHLGISIPADTNTDLPSGVEGIQSLDRSPSRPRHSSSTIDEEVDTSTADPDLHTAVPAPASQTHEDGQEHQVTPEETTPRMNINSADPSPSSPTAIFSIPCEHCNKTFSSVSNYNRHTPLHFAGLSRHLCPHPHCDHTFTRRHACNKHYESVHNAPQRGRSQSAESESVHKRKTLSPGESPAAKRARVNINQCEICGKQLSNTGNYNRHKFMHLEDSERLDCPYPDCEQRFARNDARSKHLLNRRLHPVALVGLEAGDG